MHCSIGRDDFAPGSIWWAIAKIADASARFFDDEIPGGDIPGMEFELPVGIEAAGCDITQIQRGAAVSANAARYLDDIAKAGEVVVLTTVYVVSEAGCHQGSAEINFFRYT